MFFFVHSSFSLFKFLFSSIFVQHQPSNRFHSPLSMQFKTTHKQIHQFICQRKRERGRRKENEQILCTFISLRHCMPRVFLITYTHRLRGRFSAFLIKALSSHWYLPIFSSLSLSPLDSYLLYFIHVKKALELHTIEFVICIDERRMH